MKCQSGMTLFEVLATLTLSVIFMGIFVTSFQLLNLHWDQTEQRVGDDLHARTTIRALNEQISNSALVQYLEEVPPSGDRKSENFKFELRFFKGADSVDKSIFYHVKKDTNGNLYGEIYLCTFDKSATFLNPTIDVSNFTDMIILAENIKVSDSTPVFQKLKLLSNGTEDILNLTHGEFIGKAEVEGEKKNFVEYKFIKYNITFDYTIVTKKGEHNEQTFNNTVKLLNDYNDN